MMHRTLIYLLCLMMLDIVTVPVDDRSPQREVRGQTERDTVEPSESGSSSGDGIVNLQGSIGIVDLIMAVSEINNEVYVIDGSVRPSEISIVTPGGGMNKEDLLGLFDTVLRLNGLAVVKADGVNKIVSTGDIKGASTPVETDGPK
jgi:hypothetical protein